MRRAESLRSCAKLATTESYFLGVEIDDAGAEAFRDTRTFAFSCVLVVSHAIVVSQGAALGCNLLPLQGGQNSA